MGDGPGAEAVVVVVVVVICREDVVVVAAAAVIKLLVKVAVVDMTTGAVTVLPTARE